MIYLNMIYDNILVSQEISQWENPRGNPEFITIFVQIHNVLIGLFT